jgi:hypothetical protein
MRWVTAMATDQNKPSVFAAAVTGWRDAFSAVAKMPVLFGIAVVAVIALNILSLPFIPRRLDEIHGPGIQFLGFVVELAQGFLLTPVAIAVHRFVLLGEIAGGYRLNPADPRFQRFFIFTVVVQVLMAVPGVFGTIDFGSGWVTALVRFIGVMLFIVAAVVSLRTLILFPAIAVDAPAAAWNNALSDTKGHSWRVFFIVVVMGLPAIVIYAPLEWWVWWSQQPSTARIAAAGILQSVFGVLMIAAFAAMASRLYLVIADRLGRPLGLAPAT